MPDSPMDPAAYLRRLHDDFEFFLRELWDDRGLNAVAPLGAFEVDMARHAAGQPTNPNAEVPMLRGVMGYRQMGKTNLCTIPIACHRLYRDPNWKILIVCRKEGEAVRTVQLIRKYLESVWFLQHLVPRPSQLDSQLAFDVNGCGDSRQPSVSAIGVTGTLEGNRANTIIADDIETKGNTKTQEARDELFRMSHEFVNIFYGSLKTANEVVVIGTPKHADSLYGRMGRPNKEGKPMYTFQSYPFLAPRPGDNTLFLAPIVSRAVADRRVKPGQCLATHRFSQKDIDARMGLPEEEFLREFQMAADVGSRFAQPIRLRDLIVYPCHRDKAPVSIAWGTSGPNGPTRSPIPSLSVAANDYLYEPIFVDERPRAPYANTIAGLDPAGRGSDRTGLAIVGHLYGYYYVKAVLSYQGGAEAPTMLQIAHALRDHGAQEVVYEDNIDVYNTFAMALQSAVAQLILQPNQDPRFPDGWTCSVRRERSHAQKEERIIGALQTPIQQHRVVVDPAALIPSNNPAHDPDDELQYQLTRLTHKRGCLKEDGKIDALAIAFRAHELAFALTPDDHKRLANTTNADDEYNARVAKALKLDLPTDPRRTPPRFFGRRW